MAKLTRSQAKYIEERFIDICFAHEKKKKEDLGVEFCKKEKEVIKKCKEENPQWAKIPEVFNVLVSYYCKEATGSRDLYQHQYNKMKGFREKTDALRKQLHESLLFCDGSLETAQQIINNFTNKLKEIK